MVIRLRSVFTENNNTLAIHNSAQIDFATESAMNNLLRSPAISNLKAAIESTNEVIRKYERSKQSRKRKHKED